MNKKKVVVLSLIGFTIFCMLAVMTACTAVFVNELDREAEKEEQRIEQQLEQPQVEAPVEEEPAIQDEYLTEEDVPEYIPNQYDDAMQFIQPIVDEAFGPTGLDYYLIEETADDGKPVIILIIDGFTSSEVQAGVQLGEWDLLVDDGVYTTEVMRDVLVQQGYDVHFGIMIGNTSTDEVYFSAVDGMLVLDVPNGVQ